ncbi:hypothetical protein Tco_0679044 [Tanacetum coccineum]|uniref:Uncharacterized protein n=1 Tax=Tanacetum coccineum TaxID=301880 RepID=A0ABQ4XI04_9ASTR
METQKPLLKDEDGEEVDVHMYRSMIGSLMYLTSSRPDIMFAMCVCARYQVNPKVSRLYAVKRIFRYLKGQSKLGLWYLKDSHFDLVAYTDSDYAGASLDWKSTTGGCQFLGCRLISWQCKKQTVVTNSTTEAERDLQLEDEEGVDCLPNSTIFEQLALMGVESSDNEESLGEDASKQGRIDAIDAIDADEEITLVSAHAVNVLDDVEMFVEEQDVVEEVVKVINTYKKIIDAGQVSDAYALRELKSTKPKMKGVVTKGAGERLAREEKPKKEKKPLCLD